MFCSQFPSLFSTEITSILRKVFLFRIQITRNGNRESTVTVFFLFHFIWSPLIHFSAVSFSSDDYMDFRSHRSRVCFLYYLTTTSFQSMEGCLCLCCLLIFSKNLPKSKINTLTLHWATLNTFTKMRQKE